MAYWALIAGAVVFFFAAIGFGIFSDNEARRSKTTVERTWQREAFWAWAICHALALILAFAAGGM